MSELKVMLLGTPAVMLGDVAVEVESRKALALLFYLAICQQQPGSPPRQGRDWLATLFWPEQDQARARASLRQALWLLRNAGLEPWLGVEQDALALQGDYWCDVQAFQAALRADKLDNALALYRGDLLTGFTLRDCPEFDQWLFLQADELRRALAQALEQAVIRSSESGDVAQGLHYARSWLTLDNLHEPTHRHLMQLYAYAGQHAAALRQYETCVRLLADELGVDPDAETVALYHAIKSRQVTPADKAHSATPAHSPALTPPNIPTPPPDHNLPLHLTPFIGREADIDELAQMLAEPACRLLSIVGLGGMGKTRLAVQVARRFVEAPAHVIPPLVHPFPHGVCFVPLHAVESTHGLIAAIAEASGIVFYGHEAMRQQLFDNLHARHLLLVLDNFEQLLASTDAAGEFAGDFIVDLLTHAPNLTILVTSREPLNLQGEWLWTLGGLELPADEVHPGEIGAGESNTGESNTGESNTGESNTGQTTVDHLLSSAAVRLFVQSARRVQPQFVLAIEAPHVVQICRLLGGMPLAIELAVAWLRVMSCAQVAREIANNLNFLTTRLRDLPDRHRSLASVFAHSWQLLTPSEQATFQQLSVFRGGFDFQAAAYVAESTWLDLAALKEKSLLTVSLHGRYAVHELLRQFGAGKLAENPAQKVATLDRFAAYYANFLHTRADALAGAGQLQAADEIAHEVDNLRSAWQWSLQQGRLEDIRRSATAFYFFCQLRSRFLEGATALHAAQQWLKALPPSRDRDLSLARVQCHQGWLYLRLGKFAEATDVLQHSHALYAQLGIHPQHTPSGDPLVPLALVYHVQGELPRARATLAAAAAGLHQAGVPDGLHNLTYLHYAIATTTLAAGEYEQARTYLEQAATVTRTLGNRWFLAYVLNESGKLARATGQFATAQARFQESYEIKRAFADPEGMAVALCHLGEIALWQKELTKAHALYTQAYEIYSGINDQGGLATSARGLGQVACAKGDSAAAKEWFLRALTVARQIHFWPLIYALLLDVSELLLQRGAHALAWGALTHVQAQGASDFETKRRARELQETWRATWQAAWQDQDAATPQLEEPFDRETLLARILAELTHYTPTGGKPNAPHPSDNIAQKGCSHI